MRICMILEGCYPYVRGGLSSWMHNYILGMPQHEFVLWVIGAKAEDRGKFKYDLPANVAEVHEVFLDDALRLRPTGAENLRFNPEEVEALRRLLACEDPDWSVLFRTYNVKKTGILSFLMSEAFLDILLNLCKEKYPYIAFSELFHTVRSMLLPLLYLLSQEVPQADVYHATSTGYGGLLGALASWRRNKPLVLTEHGIYTREREEEILRAQWLAPYFKQHWIRLFYMLSRCSYDAAVRVTALFQRYSDIQGELGCAAYKRRVIGNGIYTDRFTRIPLKPPNGYIDIGAIVRIAPIKDIKTMIYAFFELKSRLPQVRLHILGDTDDEEYRVECVNLIEQLQVEDLLLVGNTDTAAYLEKLDFTLLSSISEGQPLAVLESLAAARPCVTTDVGCCRELLDGTTYDDLGRAGIYEPPLHPRALADAMELLCTREDLRLEMGEIGRRRVERSFRHEDMIERYLENYREVLQLWPELVSR